MFNDRKKTALVTGASSGMGKEIAKSLIKDGYQVYVAAPNVDQMSDLVKLGATPFRINISKDDDILAAVNAVLDEAGGVDVLVNIACQRP